MSVWFGTFWDVYSNLVLSLGTNALLALSIWLTLACGMLSIANAGFMALGAYASALLTVNYGWPFPVVLAAGMAAPALMATVPVRFKPPQPLLLNKPTPACMGK